MSQPKYYYQVHGLQIATEFPMEDLSAIAKIATPDVVFSYGSLEKVKENMRDSFVDEGIAVKAETILFDITSIGLFYFPDATKVIVDLAEGCSISKAMPYIYSNVLTLLLQMRNMFTIHAAGVVVNDALVLFSGNSGIGKSTLASHLYQKGFPLFCDDRCVFYWKASDQCFYAKPSMPTIRLMKDAVETMPKSDWLKTGKKVDYKVNKMEFDLKKVIVQKEKAIKQLYIIRRTAANGELFVNPIQGNQKLNLLKKQSFKSHFVNYLGKQKEHFLFLTNVNKYLPISVIGRPQGTSIQTFSQFVANLIQKKD